MVESEATRERRHKLRNELIGTAERQIADSGLESLTARALANEVGCSVGAIYNVFEDLDDLVIAVNSNTLARLDRKIAKLVPIDTLDADPEECLVGLAGAYCQFAVEHTRLWSALFERENRSESPTPDWHMDEHVRLVAHIVAPLQQLLPRKSEEEIWSLSGLLLSAVHGVVSLGLQKFFFSAPVHDIQRQVEILVRSALRGLPDTGYGKA